MNLILASRSPRRQELLRFFGLPFSISEADVDETPLIDEAPAAMTERLARLKAEKIRSQSENNNWVLAGDTTVAIDNRILGKPADPGEAFEMLQQLSGRTHVVISALTLLGPEFAQSAVSQTEVEFDQLSDDQIIAYCDSGEPYDKAGGYGIQGLAGSFVKQIHGSYSGVVGLPLYETRLLLKQAGLL